MKPWNDLLRRELLAMDSEDQRVREELARDGSLFDGYHPRMEEVHRRNGERLKQVIQEHGWPGEPLVGEDGAFAAWRLLQHCIGDPPLLRTMLPVLWDAGRRGDIPLWHAAYLEDRIRMFEGRPQLYGSQFWTDEKGESHPYEIGHPEDLDGRRGEVGLEPFAERLATMRKVSDDEKKHAPKDYKEYMKDYEAWLKKTGWR